MLQNVAIRMTNTIRLTSQNYTHWLGKAEKNEIYIAVNFNWLILPLVSICLALLLLMLVMRASNMHSIPTFMGNSLDAMAVLEPALSRTVRMDREQAEKTMARLEKDKLGLWYLQEYPHHLDDTEKRWDSINIRRNRTQNWSTRDRSRC